MFQKIQEQGQLHARRNWASKGKKTDNNRSLTEGLNVTL